MNEPIKCRDCGKVIENAEKNRDKFFAPSPYEEEIWGVNTCYWMCEDCRRESAYDI